MANELVARGSGQLPIATMNDLVTMGRFLAQSGMFGARNEAEGLMIMSICHQKRMDFLEWMQNFDLIKGRATKKPVAMLADFARMDGCSYTIRQRDENGTILVVKRNKETQTYKCLWEDCKKEPFPYVGKEEDVVRMLSNGQTPPLKPKYVTPRSRMQMLWARCVGDAMRSFAPECCKGIYTPEEMEDVTDTTPAAPIAPTNVTVSPSPVAEPEITDPEVCPIGKMKGVRWDTMKNELLEKAMKHPAFSEETKAVIKSIIDKRNNNNEPVEAAEPEVVNG